MKSTSSALALGVCMMSACTLMPESSIDFGEPAPGSTMAPSGSSTGEPDAASSDDGGDSVAEPSTGSEVGTTGDPPPCSAIEFTCGSGECIEFGVLCDDVRDCADGSDEEACDPEPDPTNGTSACAADEYDCGNGICLDPSLLCNGISECGVTDTDEANCGCPFQNSFECDGGACIPIGFVCDGMTDCVDGTDELGC